MNTDLDIIAKALAAGREAATAYKNFQRNANGYQYAQSKLVLIYAGMEALQRLAKLPPAEPRQNLADKNHVGAGLCWAESAALSPEYKAAQKSKNEAATASLAKLSEAPPAAPAPELW